MSLWIPQRTRHGLGRLLLRLIYLLWQAPIPRVRRWSLSALGGVAVVGIAYSRLYLNAHWLTDVVGALTVGASYLLFALASLRPPRQEHDEPPQHEVRHVGDGGAETAVVRVICSVALAAGFALAWTIPAQAESSVGLTGGLTFAGDQDIMIVDRIGSARSNDVSAAIGPVGGVTPTFWWHHFGFQLDALYWGTSAAAVLPGSLKRVQVNQDRGAFLMSLMARLRLQPGGPFAYAGLGSGFAVIGVGPGQTSVQPGVSALAGFAIPVMQNFRIRTEVRYLLTHDSDPKAGRGISTEVSGGGGANPGRAVFGPHFDTQFVPLLIGLDYVF